MSNYPAAAKSSGRAGPLGPPERRDPEVDVADGLNSNAAGPAVPPYPVRRHLPHGVPQWVKTGAVYFVTVNCAVRGENQLCRPDVAEALWDAVAFRQSRGDWCVRLLLLMPDHWHAFISFPPDRDMGRVVANFKEMTAKRLGIGWQRDFFDHRLRNPQEADFKWNYVTQNPVRRGLVAKAVEWPYVRDGEFFEQVVANGRAGPPGPPERRDSVGDVAKPLESNAAGPAVPPYLNTNLHD